MKNQMRNLSDCIFGVVIFVAMAMATSSCSTANASNGDDFQSVVDAQQGYAEEAMFQKARPQTKAAVPAVKAASFANKSQLLAGAQAGECYSKVLTPAQYETVSETVTKAEASEKLTVIPAKYEMTEETIVVKPAGKRLIKVPAQYGYVSEKILEKPAHTVWKKGKGPITKLDNATGEILCKVEVPAKYSVVRKRVLKSKATVKEVAIPAEYKTIRVRKLVQDARAVRTAIPAEYQTVNRRKLVKESHLGWEKVLCETNASPSTIRSVQMGLRAKGYNPGAVDGVLGKGTLDAVHKFQKAKGLATGGLTLDSIKALGVRI